MLPVLSVYADCMALWSHTGPAWTPTAVMVAVSMTVRPTPGVP